MLRIKKLDLYILRNFLQLFAGTFFICLFIFILQFLWRYMKELVGKGLSIDVFAEFFFYSTLTLIPMSLPLAILLAALMTFGNLGERFELLSMKTAGVPLIRIMVPLIISCGILSGISFYFQNVIAPKSQQKVWTMLVSMKQTSPELDIPEGAFYNEIKGYNIFVKHKDRDTGMLNDVLIYNVNDGFDNAHIIWSAEGKLETTADKQHLLLHLYNGEQFENLKSQNISADNVPYRRETFREKHIIIEFDGGFNMVDGSYLGDRSDTKNMAQISRDIDSLSLEANTVGQHLYTEAKNSTYNDLTLNHYDSTRVAKGEVPSTWNTDSVYRSYTMSEKFKVLDELFNKLEFMKMDWATKSMQNTELDKDIRRHESDWHKKITLALACLVFFFIGAPLGAIIRKGGLGLPVVISVIIFVLYYIIDSGSTRVARSGEMNIMLGVWMSTLVLAPIGTFFTYKSNNDSMVFNLETYISLFRQLLGLRTSRHVGMKEVVIEDPDYAQDIATMHWLDSQCQTYRTHAKLSQLPSYANMFFARQGIDDAIAQISQRMETLVEDLSNSKSKPVLQLLDNYPIMSANAHKTPFANRWVNLAIGLILPLGLIFYLRTWRNRIRLGKDLTAITETNNNILEQLAKENLGS